MRLAISLIIAAIFAAFAGFLIGIPVLRLNGDYLAIVTLAFGEIIKAVLNNLYVSVDNRGLKIGLFEGPGADFTGKRIIQGPMGIGGIQKISNFTAGFILIMITLLIIFNLVNSRAGRAIMAIRRTCDEI